MKYILTTCCVIICFFANAQNKLEKANDLFKQKSYIEAAENYNDYILNTKDIVKSDLLNAADANFLIRDYSRATLYYQRAYNISDNLKAPYIYRYANSLRRLKEYDRANSLVLEFYRQQDSLKSYLTYKNDINEFQALKDDSYYTEYKIENLDINSPNSDFSPVVFNDKLYFSSSRQSSNKQTYSWNNQPFLNIYSTSKLENNNFGDLKVVDSDVKTSFHEATIAFKPNDSIVFFSANSNEINSKVDSKFSKSHFKLYKGVFKNDEIINVTSLYFNSNFYSVGHPTVSSDGRYLFFASDMPNGYGGADIYYLEIFEDGTLGTYKNAGPLVNSFGNDFFPTTIGNTLYFSSDGHLGFGGLDIFKTTFDNDLKFTNTKNLGKGINTNYDDFSMFFETETTGYFSSNRPKGKGDDDIYSFVKQEESCISNYTIKTIQLNEDFPISEVKILVVDGFGDVVKELETDSSGEVKFNFPCSKEFSIKTEKIDYDVYEAERKDFEINEDKSFSLDVRMYKPSTLFKTTKNGEEQLRLDPIYFELDKWAITEESKIILNQVVNIMNSFPDMVIKIESHTDSRDSQDFNLILSNKRAIATSNYIINEGISPERIESAVGYGEYRLINGCADDVHCSEKEHLENRRSEFIVVKR